MNQSISKSSILLKIAVLMPYLKWDTKYIKVSLYMRIHCNSRRIRFNISNRIFLCFPSFYRRANHNSHKSLLP